MALVVYRNYGTSPDQTYDPPVTAIKETAVRMSLSTRLTRAFGFLLLLTNSFSIDADGQVSFAIATISHSDPVPGQSLVVHAELNEPTAYSRVYFRYRVFSSSEFITLEMDLTGQTATARIPGENVVAPFIEYYMIFAREDGSAETLPPGSTADPFSSPPGGTLQIQVRDIQGISGVTFLSPEIGGRLDPDEVVIAASLLRTDSTIVREATRLWLDGIDVTDQAVFSGDLLVFVPDNAGMELSSGKHTAAIRLFDIAGKLVGQVFHEFRVAGPGLEMMAPPEGPQVTGSALAESRHETIANSGTWYNRADIRLRGRMEDWSVVTNVFVTSDEKADRQPQNRFYGGVESSWLQLGYGDSYPVFPSLIMNGMRLRGFTGRIQGGPQIFMAAIGEISRGVEGALLQTIPNDSLAIEQQKDPTAAYAPLDQLSWGKFNYGTYQRDLVVLRTETRLGTTGGIGITALKGKDDLSSISYGTQPKENLVAGLDFRGSFDERRIEINGQAAFSAYNFDISSGTFTDVYIDTTFGESADDVKYVKDVLNKFITVNDNLRPLSLNELSTLAYEAGLGLNYFHNVFTVKYIYRGSDYFSFGQTYIRTDIQGITAADRISISQDQILLSLGFERLQDNTSNFKVATTTFRNITAALSFYPRIAGPSITVGFGNYGSNNGISTQGIDSLLSIDDEDNRVYLQSTYNFEFRARHTASFNVSTSSRTDSSPRRLNVNSTIASLRLLSRYTIPLETGIDISLSYNSIPSPGGMLQRNDYTTISLNGLYRMFEDRLFLEGRISPTLGDVNRTVWDAAARWVFTPNLSAQMRYTYFVNKGIPDDNIWRTTLRYDL